MTSLRPIGQPKPKFIVPQYVVDSFTPEGVVVQVHNQDGSMSEFLVDWSANREGAEMHSTCTLTISDEDSLFVEQIKTPDWIHYALPNDVEGYLTRRAEEDLEDSLIPDAGWTQ